MSYSCLLDLCQQYSGILDFVLALEMKNGIYTKYIGVNWDLIVTLKDIKGFIMVFEILAQNKCMSKILS